MRDFPSMGTRGGRGPKIAIRISDVIRDRIVSGELVPGDGLPREHELAEQFEVSRPIVREALHILEHESLIEIRRGAKGGAYVRRPAPAFAAEHAQLLLETEAVTLADVCEARTAIEAPAAAVLAERCDPDDVRQLREQLAEFDRAIQDGDDESDLMPYLSEEFHALVVELAGNRTLALFESMVRHILTRGGRQILDDFRPGIDRLAACRTSLQSHLELVDLIEAGDAMGADRHWRAHLHRSLVLAGDPGPLNRPRLPATAEPSSLLR